MPATLAAEKESYRFAVITSADAAQAFTFHKNVGVNNPHIWLRTDEEIKAYAEEGSLFGVWRIETQELVASTYLVLDEQTNEWELGGLLVAKDAEKRGIPTLLVRFALGYTVVQNQIWANGQEVIAHVHEDNSAPRNIFKRLNFEFIRKVEAPASAPASMKRNANGKVVGDKFRFTKRGLQELSRWFDEEFDGTLGLTTSTVEFDLGLFGLENIKTSLREIVQDLKV